MCLHTEKICCKSKPVVKFLTLLEFLVVLFLFVIRLKMMEDWNESWVFRLVINLLGYATVIIPGFGVVYYYKNRKISDSSSYSNSCLLIKLYSQYIKLFVYGNNCTILPEKTTTDKRKPFILLFCFIGLLSSLLVWGFKQEKIMTQDYSNSSGDIQKFSDSQFLVFSNRFLAFVFSGLYLSFTRPPKHMTPYYKYSFCSFSNILSSWFQYEALKYVSFPTQVLGKASKIIFVMLMGKIISQNTYKLHEYIKAVGILIGAGMFFSSGKKTDDILTTTTVSGIIIMISYIIFDSFTPNWQDKLYKQYYMSPAQMMCGVNLFSCGLTAISLLQQGGFSDSMLFVMRFPSFFVDCLFLSLSSALGQCFVFYTISEFGAVTFTIMMTIRQVLAILLSCVYYGHDLSLFRVLGLVIVFITILISKFMSIGYLCKSYRTKQLSSGSQKV